MSQFRATRTLTAAAAAVLLAAAPAAALNPTASVGGSISPDHGRPGTPLKLTTTLRVDPGPGETPGTVNRVVLQFPPNATVNGNLFPACPAAVINRAGGRFSKCPKGSQIGRGSLRGDVPNLDLSNVPGRVTLFNGPGGKSITVHIYLTNPALISIAFDAPLRKTSGRYGYTMTNPVPEGLQTLIQPDSYGALRTLTATVGITKKIRGRTRGYIEAKRCPKSGRVPIAGQFFFNEESSQASAEGEIKCKP
jgi:hypothetical protein